MKPIRPAWQFVMQSPHHAYPVVVTVLVPDRVTPMDIYNNMSKQHNLAPTERDHGWLTDKGTYITAEKAAQIALDRGYIDRRVKALSISQYTGQWKLS